MAKCLTEERLEAHHQETCIFCEFRRKKIRAEPFVTKGMCIVQRLHCYLQPQKPTTPGVCTFLNLPDVRNYHFSYKKLTKQWST